MQVFIYKDRGFTRELVARSAAAGYDIVLTIDNQLLGNRERHPQRIHIPHASPPTLAGMALRVDGCGACGKSSSAYFRQLCEARGSADIKIWRAHGIAARPSMSWDDVDTCANLAGAAYPQGHSQPEDAKSQLSAAWTVLSFQIMVAGSWMAPATLTLPRVAEAVATYLILLDGGVRRCRWQGWHRG
jgi:L-lactate dehydrogenase (cytochrome)/(S)-mandelate dehydrogenase